MLLGLPPPQLISSTPWIIYPTVHVLLSTAFRFFSLPDARFLDTALPLVDAVTRSAPICGAVDAVRYHKNEAISYSLTAQIISSAVASAGASADLQTPLIAQADRRGRARSASGSRRGTSPRPQSSAARAGSSCRRSMRGRARSRA